jgi:hypothetical protein
VTYLFKDHWSTVKDANSSTGAMELDFGGKGLIQKSVRVFVDCGRNNWRWFNVICWRLITETWGELELPV